MGEKLDVGEIMQRIGQIARLSSGAALLYIAVLSAASIAADLTDPEGGAGSLLVNVLGIAAGFMLIRAVVRNAELNNGFQRGFGGYFGLSILSGLGIFLGLLFLVIPGLFLMVRWQPAFAILMSEEDATVSGSLEKAWSMTSGHFWPLLAATLIGVVLIGVSMMTYVSFDLGYPVPFEVSTIVGNIMLSCSTVYFTVLGVAAYSLLRTEQQGLDEIFA